MGNIESFIISFIVFMWLVSSWEFFNLLSLGRIRRIESRDRAFAEVMESWLENRVALDIAFKILIFSSIAVVSVSAVSVCKYFNISFGSESLTVVLFVLAALIIGEAVAKAALSRLDISVLKYTIPVIMVLRYSILFPFVFVIQFVQSSLEQFNAEDRDERTTAEDEIMSLVEMDESDVDGEHALEDDERKMIKGIFELDDTAVKEIMTPRVDVQGLPIDTLPKDAKTAFVETGHSRIPVYEASIDVIKGIIYAKDFLDDALIEKSTLKELMHEPYFIPEMKAIDDLLDEVKRNNTHMAVIIDEYGGTAGIVTLEDIIEEIVGEIHDEYDSEKEEHQEPVWADDVTVTLAARTTIFDVNELMVTTISEEGDSDTIGGLICEVLGKIPEEGEEAILNDVVHATVLKADGRRVITVLLKKLDTNEQ